MSDDRIVASEVLDDESDAKFRPQRLVNFIGQKKASENLEVFISAAVQRAEPLDHVLFHGPPGLGKTTLAQIIAQQLNREIYTLSAINSGVKDVREDII